MDKMCSKQIETKVIKASYNKIQEIGLNCNGTIFGGYVRDLFIAEYYTDMFKKENYDENKFWNNKYCKKYNARMIVSNDMDICFNSKEDSQEFVNKIHQVPEFSSVVVEYNNNNYNNSNIRFAKKLKISVIIGAIPFYSKGIECVLNVDMVVQHEHFKMEPPFMSLDFLCNGFILSKNSPKTFSRHTGTAIDNYSDYDRTMAIAFILQDLVNFKTKICLSPNVLDDDIYFNNNILRRILKMTYRKFPWSFTNLPFHTGKITNFSTDYSNDTCCICMENFKNTDTIAFTSNTSSDIVASAKMHYMCCLKYLKHQRICENDNQDKKIIFRCPYRNTIDFSNCYENI